MGVQYGGSTPCFMKVRTIPACFCGSSSRRRGDGGRASSSAQRSSNPCLGVSAAIVALPLLSVAEIQATILPRGSPLPELETLPPESLAGRCVSGEGSSPRSGFPRAKAESPPSALSGSLANNVAATADSPSAFGDASSKFSVWIHNFLDCKYLSTRFAWYSQVVEDRWIIVEREADRRNG